MALGALIAFGAARQAMIMFKQLGVIGTGLMGGSFALALRELRDACAFFKLLGTYPVDSH